MSEPQNDAFHDILRSIKGLPNEQDAIRRRLGLPDPREVDQQAAQAVTKAEQLIARARGEK